LPNVLGLAVVSEWVCALRIGAGKVDGKAVYYRTQGEAVVWKDHGLWMVDFALDPASPTIHVDLGRTRSKEQALHWADMTIMGAAVELHQSYEDVRNVVNLAKETEDRTPEGQASIDRLEESLIKGRPDFPDPSDDWIDTFCHDMQEEEARLRSQERDENGYEF
jgi:hypothetical protein